MDSKDSSVTEIKEILSLSDAINHLGLSLYQELAQEKKNVFFSPISLSSALAMLFCGARGSVLDEMREALGFKTANIPDDKVKHYFQLLYSALENVPDSYTLKNANVVFSQKDFTIEEEFKSLLLKSFGAMTLEADFQTESEHVVQQANDWVEEKTNGMIPKLLDSLDPSTVMVLLNAVYFKGFWTQQFEKQATLLQTFYNNGLDSNAKMVNMMHQMMFFPFADLGSYMALQLPYKGNDLAMLILLPSDRNGLEELESKITLDFLAQTKTKLIEQDVNVTLPKFRLEYSKSMKDDFKSLGMNAMFKAGADFGGISSQNICVSDIVHKAVIEVNEEGSEAAAATAVMNVQCSYEIDPDFIADHPFLFLIYNLKSNLILFMGKVNEL